MQIVDILLSVFHVKEEVNYEEFVELLEGLNLIE